ncbi:TPM domain-containing protein [Corynebacterium otitidis]
MFAPQSKSNPRRRRALAAALAGGGLAAAALTPAIAAEQPAAVLAQAPVEAAPDAAAAAANLEFSSTDIADEAGVLDPGTIEELQGQIDEFKADSGRALLIVFSNDLGSRNNEEISQAIMAEHGGSNTALLAVDVEHRIKAIAAGSQWSQSEGERLDEATAAPLAGDDFAGAARAFVDAAAGNSGGSGGGWGIVLGAGAIIVVGGGGLWLYSRRSGKKREENELEQARRIEPTDHARLVSQPRHALETLAEEAVVATDESIRLADEELRLARSEFGAERTRPFERAMERATTVMRRAYHTEERLGGPLEEGERKNMLAAIVSHCAEAQAELDKQAEAFKEMRGILLTADTKVSELTQRTIDVRSRLPRAEETLAALGEKHSAEALSSISDNVTLAAGSLDEAERHLEEARALADKPAGQQQGLVTAIRDGEHAVEVAGRMLAAIENADEDIHAAEDNLPDLIEEISGEIDEAAELRSKGHAIGTKANWDDLDRLVTEAKEALAGAHERGRSDPLRTMHELTELDSRIDDALDRVREKTADQARLLELYGKQARAARRAIQAAEDLVASRGRIVGRQPRAALEEAKRMLEDAEASRTDNPRQAIEQARGAAERADAARKGAQRDVDDYRRRHSSGGGGGGAFLAGMLVNGILSSGSRGGGFGGGGFSGGGGFGGGGGGGFSAGGRF